MLNFFSESMDSHQITDSGSSENAKAYKYKNIKRKIDIYASHIQSEQNQ